MKRDAVRLAQEFGTDRIIAVSLAVPGLFINRPEKNEEIFMVSEFEEPEQGECAERTGERAGKAGSGQA